MAIEAAARNSAIDKMLERAAGTGDVPGVVAMATDRDGTIYQGAFGKRVLGQPAAMSLDTVAWIASMTKAVTGAAAMQLVEQGKLDLDAPAEAVVGELARANVLKGSTPPDKPKIARTEAADHAAPPADPYRRFWLRDLERDVAAYRKAAERARHHHLPDRRSLNMPLLFDPGRAVGIRHQHRLGRANG